MKEEIFRIAKEIEIIQNKINSISEEDYELVNEYSKELFNLKYKLQTLEKQYFLERNPEYSNDEIDLYIKNYHDLIIDNPDSLTYYITKHNSKELIGTTEVRFNLSEKDKYLGNMGANINPIYRGNRYSSKTVKLLKEPLVKRGLIKPIFTVEETNQSSIKSLINMGAEQIEYVSNTDKPYYVFEYDYNKQEDNTGIKK